MDMLTWLHTCLMQCTLGGFEELQSMKAEKRAILGLPPLPEDIKGFALARSRAT